MTIRFRLEVALVRTRRAILVGGLNAKADVGQLHEDNVRQLNCRFEASETWRLAVNEAARRARKLEVLGVSNPDGFLPEVVPMRRLPAGGRGSEDGVSRAELKR